MGLRINTNIPALTAMRSITKTNRDMERSMKQLASGNRFADITEGAGDFAIAEGLKAQSKGIQAAHKNAENAISFVQIAEGGLNEQSNILIRMRELAVQSASDTFSDTERNFMDFEFQQLQQEFDRVAQTTSYGSQKLLNGDGKEYEFQVGTSDSSDSVVSYTSNTNTSGSELGISGLDVQDKSAARSALKDIDYAIVEIGKARANYGAVQSRFDHISNYTATQVEALESARSKIADTDIPAAYSEMQKGMALQQYQLAVLNEAVHWPGKVIKLIA